jgi:alpha-L-rhamnosidase
MRIVCDTNPFPSLEMPGVNETADFPARWVWHPDAGPQEPTVLAFRLPFKVDEATTVRLHVTADHRYELFCNGQRLGRGPERGDPAHWFHETYELELEPGDHLLAARAWWFPEDGSPMAQMTVAPGFMLYAEGKLGQTLSTGSGAWEVCRIAAYGREPIEMRAYYVVGWSFALDGAQYPWGWESDPATPAHWVAPKALRPPVDGLSSRYYSWESAQRTLDPHLMPAMLPPMLEKPRQGGRVRYATWAETDGFLQVDPAAHDAELAAAIQAMLDGQEALRVAAGRSLRAVIDLEDYYCGYPELLTSDGAGAEITLGWTEALYEISEGRMPSKGNRDVVDGKLFYAPRDRFILEGGVSRSYDTLWWRAGRYLELTVRTGDAPVSIDGLAIRETRYPLERESTFASEDSRANKPPLDSVSPIMVRALQMCSHETYMDCPYYEQLMYAGDTRLEILATYVTTADPRLPLKACQLFDWSRSPDGLTKSRYPSQVPQVIAPFSLWWVSMVHDLYLWRDAETTVRELLPGVDSVLTAFAGYRDEAGLVSAIPGWSYCDWVPEWRAGWPPDSRHGANALINLIYLYALDRGIELHEAYGQRHLAAHWREVNTALRRAIVAAYWEDQRGMLADDRAHTCYSEHTQALAILTHLLDGERRERMIVGLLGADDLARTTIYFSHYLLEALREIGRVDLLIDKLDFWFGLQEKGLKTTSESPEPTRSDCHAWGAHPLYHYYASILGARPGAPGFRRVRIAPQFGPLTAIRGEMPHPTSDMLRFDLRREGDVLRGELWLPEGVTGELVWGDEERSLKSGYNPLA